MEGFLLAATFRTNFAAAAVWILVSADFFIQVLNLKVIHDTFVGLYLDSTKWLLVISNL